MDKKQEVKEYEKISHTQIKNLNFFLINLTYRAPHTHHDFEILQVIEGELHVKTLTEDFLIGPGEIALFNPDTLHTLYSVQSHCILLAIQADPSFCSSHYPAIQHIQFDTANVTSSIPFQQALEMIQVCFNLGYHYCCGAPGFELRCLSDLYRLFSYFVVYVPNHFEKESDNFHSKEKEQRLTRIINHIHQHYTEKLTLSELAESENLSMTYLSHLFKNAMQMSFQEYLNSLRFEHALLLLKKTDMNIIDICIESGFSDSKYLNKRLKAAYNLSIKDFKNTNLNLDKNAADKWEEQYIYTPGESLEIMRKHHHFDCDKRNREKLPPHKIP